MHGGSVGVRSDGPSLGSEFVVRLPEADGASAPLAPSPEPTPPGGQSAKSSRVLIVDDNVDAAQGLARLLKRIGHDVKVAHGGHEAIEVGLAHRPEIVLLDIGLPGMDGYQVAAHLRGVASVKDALIIAVSGYGQEQDRIRSREAGFDHHLVKPVDYDDLLSLLDRTSIVP